MTSNFTGFASASLQLGAQLASIMIKPRRGFSGLVLPNGLKLPDIVAQATIRERHLDELEITDHPVEVGAPISDHAFKRPVEVTLELGWSNSPSLSSAMSVAAAGVGLASLNSTVQRAGNAVAVVGGVGATALSLLNGADASQINAIYRNLLAMQANRAIFTIYTGKRMYENMICRSIATQTDAKTANSLPITMVCRQLILVNTSTVTLTKDTQANPSATASPIDKGTKQLVPATNPPTELF